MNTALIITAALTATVFALIAWLLWRQFEFYDKRDGDDGQNS